MNDHDELIRLTFDNMICRTIAVKLTWETEEEDEEEQGYLHALETWKLWGSIICFYSMFLLCKGRVCFYGILSFIPLAYNYK